jgi:hypothetical protein
VTIATIIVDRGTLDRAVSCDDRGIVLTSTTGTFTVTCVPSIKAAVPPVPDPVPVKRGKWSIERPGQTVGTSG